VLRGRRIAPWAVAVLVLAGCVSRPSVDVALIGLAPVASTLFEQRLRLDFRLQNFGQQAIRARGFEVTLNVNGRRLARGVDDGAFVLTGLGETRASAVVSTSLFEVARQLLELSGRERFSYELNGRLHLDGWPRSVPFTRTGEISRADLQRLVGAGGLPPQPLTL
jgi:LEA14-like dessication related protein